MPPCILHAPGSLVTYEPQWGSDVFGMYQSLVEGRYVPWELLVKDVPKKYHQDLDYLVEQLDWEGNVDPHVQGQPLPRADPRQRAAPRRATWTSGSSTAKSTARNCSAPRS